MTNTNLVPDGVLAIRSEDAVLKLDVMKRNFSDVQQKCHGGTPSDGNAHGKVLVLSANVMVRTP